MSSIIAYPEYVRALRGLQLDALYGPEPGVSLAAAADQHDHGRFDRLAGLWFCLNNVMSIPVADGLAPGIPYQATLLPGHVGFQFVDPYKPQPAFPFVRGPSPGCADVVIVGKHPSVSDEQVGWLLSDENGIELRTAAHDAGVPDGRLEKAYVTNVCRFLPPEGGKFKRSWVKECMWLLWAELAIIRPKLVVLLGAEAIKTFHGNGASVQRNRGVITPYKLQLNDTDVIELPTFCTIHPNAVKREPTLRGGLSADLARAYSYVSGVARKTRARNYSVERSVLRTVDAVREYVDARVAANDLKFAIDCEWAGNSVWNNGRLMTVQLSHAIGEAVLIPMRRHPRGLLREPEDLTRYTDPTLVSFVPALGQELLWSEESTTASAKVLCKGVLNDAGVLDFAQPVEVLNRLELAWSPEEYEQVVAQLKRLLHRPGVGVGGHNFRADFPWLEQLGIPLHEQYLNGFDTMLKHHLLCESGAQDLNALLAKYTDMDRYDAPLNEFLASGVRSLIDDNHGFGMVPEDILYPYALHDAAATFWINEELDREFADNSSEDRTELRGLLQIEMRASIGILEIESGGLTVDVERIRHLADKYADKRAELADELRQQILWADFNFRSVQHVRELLFGADLNGRAYINGVPDQLRPEGAYCCRLTPIKTTSKPPRDWAKVVEDEETRIHSPSTDKESLGILADLDHVADQLRKLRFVDQVCKGFTAQPLVSDDGETTERGLMAYVDPDNRVRTHIFQTTETGRWASSRPNLQNIPSRREPQLHAMFDKDDKPPKIRTVFMADPGCVLVESDFSQAELVVLALLSGDPKFWDALMDTPTYQVLADLDGHVKYWLHDGWMQKRVTTRAGDLVPAGTVLGEFRDHTGAWAPLRLPEALKVGSHKWKRDLHAERAISGFRMPYSAVLHGPPKAFVENIGKDKRIAAKTVNFGIPYGRSAPAIARELRQDGVKIEVNETQAMVDGWHEEFALASQFLDRCKWCVAKLGYLITPFGRRRRFARLDDEKMMAKQQREGCNFPIQSTVADCLNTAVANVWEMRADIRRRLGFGPEFRLALGIHDALLFVCRPESLRMMLKPNGFIDTAMSGAARVPLPREYATVCGGLYSNVDVAKFPYAIGVDKTVDLRWASKPNKKKEPAAYAAWTSELTALGVPTELFAAED